MSDEDNVKRLPVRFKQSKPEERSVVHVNEVAATSCHHLPMFGAQYIVDERLAEIRCSLCNANLNPMWVLSKLASQDRRMEEAQQRYQSEMQRLAERQRTKCDHCGKMTRISRAQARSS